MSHAMILMSTCEQKLYSPLIIVDTNKTEAIVLKLIEPLLKQGQTVWLDNFYN
jgi:hypothetical protein